MTIPDIMQISNEFIENHTVFVVSHQLFLQPNGRNLYNQLIRQQVPANSYGVYIWVKTQTGEIIYIGMAGKVKTNGQMGSHSIENRLVATRGKVNGRDVLTNDYVFNFMKNNKVEALTFHILYTNGQTPPSYLEAVLLYNFYRQKGALPSLNNSF
ncbi:MULTISPECIES: hypothetical protein [Flavobacterium]|uniref:hypothetical protein n=1 Tax=Flavobacterium TaxID=237 RepID=UPI001FCBBF21|nr:MULTISPECIES: hypothetical protein [Flavobacterium]UOK42516.1 hypothetical protein LZF87_14560 [Flavobacterium enshiense]